MDKQKLETLMKNEEFLAKICKMQTPEEVKAEFKKEGIEMTDKEFEEFASVFAYAIQQAQKGKPLTEADLQKAAGGVSKLGKVGIGIASTAAALAAVYGLDKWGFSGKGLAAMTEYGGKGIKWISGFFGSRKSATGASSGIAPLPSSM